MKLKAPKVSVPFNKNIVIKTAAIAAVTILVVVLGAGVSSAWQAEQNKKQAQDAKTAVAAQKQAAATQAKIAKGDAAVAGYNAMYVECGKGKSIYDNILTPAQKLAAQRAKAVPNCGTAVLPQ